MSEPIVVEREGPLCWLTLNDPPRNAIGLAMVDQLEALLTTLDEDREVRVLVIRGAGERDFSVGANIREFGEAVARLGLEGFLGQRLRLLEQLENLRKPVICAIHGACVGGGLELALAAHFRIAARGARLGLPEIELGIVPAWGGTQRLTRTVGRAHALDLMLRARLIEAEEAQRIGLVHDVCSLAELEARARELARELASKPPLAVAGILAAVIGGEFRPLPEGLALEREAITQTSASRDAREGLRSFFEKRKPVFRGE
ncbi:MAG: enoyl-CoA hydratase/isomerase family protein [Myxococcota bacterium]